MSKDRLAINGRPSAALSAASLMVLNADLPSSHNHVLSRKKKSPRSMPMLLLSKGPGAFQSESTRQFISPCNFLRNNFCSSEIEIEILVHSFYNLAATSDWIYF